MQLEPLSGHANAVGMRIEVAQPQDIPSLQRTAAISWRTTYGGYLASSYIEDFLARAYRNERLLTQVADRSTCFLVAKSGDEVIGFGEAGPAFQRDDEASVAPADLYRLYLLPEWQRRGIGSELLVELEAWLRGQAYPFYGVYVHERNTPAQAFYLRQGFTRKPECDVRDEWYLVKSLGG